VLCRPVKIALLADYKINLKKFEFRQKKFFFEIFKKSPCLKRIKIDKKPQLKKVVLKRGKKLKRNFFYFVRIKKKFFLIVWL